MDFQAFLFFPLSTYVIVCTVLYRTLCSLDCCVFVKIDSKKSISSLNTQPTTLCLSCPLRLPSTLSSSTRDGPRPDRLSPKARPRLPHSHPRSHCFRSHVGCWDSEMQVLMLRKEGRKEGVGRKRTLGPGRPCGCRPVRLLALVCVGGGSLRLPVSARVISVCGERGGQRRTYNVEFVFAFFVLDVLVHFFEPSRERAPPLRGRTVPDEDVPLVRRGRYRRFRRMPLQTDIQVKRENKQRL